MKSCLQHWRLERGGDQTQACEIRKTAVPDLD
jgi:hypothetical protein